MSIQLSSADLPADLPAALPAALQAEHLISPPPQAGPSGPPVRLGILASGSGSNFEAIAQAIAQGQLNATIAVLIYNNPGAGVVARGNRHNIPSLLLNHRDYDSREALDAKIVASLQAHGVEWVVMAGWMRIVTPMLIDAFAERMINIHPSLLPSFKGLGAIDQALASGVTIAGCTVHLVTAEMDSGPVLMQAAVPILPGDTAESLHQRVQVQEHRILPGAIALAVNRARARLTETAPS